MDIKKLSASFKVKKLTEENLDEMLALCKQNKIFYNYCQPAPTKESLLEDLSALPPNKTLADKFFVGFYQENHLVAICDLILGYPNAATAFIGLFMVNANFQGQGIGTKIIQEICGYLKELSFIFIQLAYVKGNPQSKAFWEKNGFLPTGVEHTLPEYTKIVMQRKL